MSIVIISMYKYWAAVPAAERGGEQEVVLRRVRDEVLIRIFVIVYYSYSYYMLYIYYS